MQVYICTKDDIELFKKAVMSDSVKNEYKKSIGEELMVKFLQTVEDTRG